MTAAASHSTLPSASLIDPQAPAVMADLPPPILTTPGPHADSVHLARGIRRAVCATVAMEKACP